MKYIILILFSQLCYSQLHHQAISSQAITKKTNSGLLITQTIGQQSVTGNHNTSKILVSSGYQQSTWKKLIGSNSQNLSIKIYPNPVINEITIEMPNNVADNRAQIFIFDVSGKLVLERSLSTTENSFTQNLEILSTGSYLLLFQSNQINYYTKLIKK